MEHYRRKKLIQDLRGLYLDNFKESQLWSYQMTQRMLGYYSALMNRMEIDDVRDLVQEIQDKQQKARENQLRLF